MEAPGLKTLRRRYGDIRVNLIYLGRLIRAQALRVWLRLCLVLFSLEEKIRPGWKSPEKKILMMVVGGMGDCLLFDTLFRRVREQWPGSRIDVLTMAFPDLWQRLDSVDNLILFRPEKTKTLWSYLRFFRTLYRNHYDIAVEGLAMVPKGGIYPLFSALVLEASRAPLRVGRRTTGQRILLHPRWKWFFFQKMMSTGWGRNDDPAVSPANTCLTHAIRLLPSEVRTYHESSQVLAPLGIDYHRKKDEPKLQPDPLLDPWAERLLREEWAAKDDIIVGFTTETTKSIKSWPAPYYASVLEWGIERKLRFLLLGLKEQAPDSPLKQFSREHLLDLSGKTALGEMIALIRQCDLFLSCDSGPAHVAQACRVPTIVLFGPSNEKEFGPIDHDLHTLLLPPADFNCRPCVLGPCVKGRTCVQAIPPETVFEALMKRVGDLSEQRPYRRSPDRRKEKLPNVLCVI